MPRPGVAAARRTARRAINAYEGAAAERRFTRAQRRLKPSVVVCWDLDNTLVDSGSLLRAGRPLDAAVREAAPMPGMLEFAAAVRTELPAAAHFALSARSRGMRAPTLAWLALHQVGIDPAVVALVPSPALKPRLWEAMAGRSRLVIVDDLSLDHEAETPSVHTDLVARARAIADVYVGPEEITSIASDPYTAARVVARIANL